MRLRHFLCAAVGLVLLVPAWSQSGPKKEGSDTVARPRKKAGDAPEPERAPIE